MNKKIISILLVLAMFLSGSVLPAFAAETDSEENIDIEKKIHEGYVNGYSDGTIKPENNITRAEVAALFFRMIDEDTLDLYRADENGFKDVEKDAWYNEAVSTLSNAEIINGYSNGTFNPDGYITRAEFAAIASRLYGKDYNGGNLFNDIEGHWAAQYINQAASTGLVKGYEGKLFLPDKKITRAEAITMMNRALDRVPSEYDFSYFEESEKLITFPDCPRESWYYNNICEAANTHEFETAGPGRTEKWINIME